LTNSKVMGSLSVLPSFRDRMVRMRWVPRSSCTSWFWNCHLSMAISPETSSGVNALPDAFCCSRPESVMFAVMPSRSRSFDAAM